MGATIFTMLLGAHESVAGGAWNAIARGREDGCEAVQIFARPSQQWRSLPFGPDEVSLFRSEHATVGWPAMSHASYLINVCAGDAVILRKSLDALEEELVRAEELGLDFVVLHPGAHLGAGREDGIEAAAESLSDVLERTRGFRVRLLLEITAGQGSCLGCRFDDMPADNHQVTLSVSGPGSIVGPTTVTMKGGQLATWIKPGRTAGTITVTASANGLTSGTATLTSQAVAGLPAAPADRP